MLTVSLDEISTGIESCLLLTCKLVEKVCVPQVIAQIRVQFCQPFHTVALLLFICYLVGTGIFL